MSAAAGVACLEIVRDPAIQRRATRTADDLRAGFTEILARRSIQGEAGGDTSFVAVTFPGVDPGSASFRIAFRLAMQMGGVDVPNPNLVVSAVHDGADVAQTIDAFDGALTWLARGSAARRLTVQLRGGFSPYLATRSGTHAPSKVSP